MKGKKAGRLPTNADILMGEINPYFSFRIYSICAEPSNCATLRYYSKGFILVSGNNSNYTAPSNSTAPHFL